MSTYGPVRRRLAEVATWVVLLFLLPGVTGLLWLEDYLEEESYLFTEWQSDFPAGVFGYTERRAWGDTLYFRDDTLDYGTYLPLAGGTMTAWESSTDTVFLNEGSNITFEVDTDTIHIYNNTLYMDSGGVHIYYRTDR